MKVEWYPRSTSRFPRSPSSAFINGNKVPTVSKQRLSGWSGQAEVGNQGLTPRWYLSRQGIISLVGGSTENLTTLQS